MLQRPKCNCSKMFFCSLYRVHIPALLQFVIIPGLEYQILAGPAYIAVFSVSLVVMGVASDKLHKIGRNRKEMQLSAENIKIANLEEHLKFCHTSLHFVKSRPTINRLMAIGYFIFSVSSLLTGFAQEYWHLVVLRMGVAIGKFTPSYLPCIKNST
jgi:MFS family permease